MHGGGHRFDPGILHLWLPLVCQGRPLVGGLIGGDAEMIFGRILVATDGTEAAQRGVELAASLAARDEAELLLLATVHVPYHVVRAANWDPSTVHRYVEKLARQHLASAVEHLKAGRIGAEVKVLVGPPVEVLLTEIETAKPDLVVIGRGTWVEPKDLVLGSVSTRVAQQAKVPVLLVP